MNNALVTFIFFCLSSFSSFAGERRDCFSAINKHITEAIAHNSLVQIRYSHLSNGDSYHLSSTLIGLEKMSRLLIKNIERESKFYQEKGIALLCDELTDMKSIPEFQDQLAENLRPVRLYPYNYQALNRNLRHLLRQDLLEDAYQLIASDLYRLEAEPQQQCLTRHFLESMARTLKLSATHREAALKLGLPDPIKTIKKFITLQQRGLFLTHYLDTQAFPLQKDGLLIFCQDVPSIDWK